ncbi:MAG: LysM domain-containing protein [Wenzhouxiangella sp.]|jgi:Tfp pilus assembly protein PilF|nr:LysM domain-containing protein [Wenzhouxiangella sp.]
MLQPPARVLVILLTCLALAGCQLWPFKRPDGAEERPPGQAGTGSESEAARSADSIGRAMTLLQNGEEERAERMLAAILEGSPGSPTAKLLLAQIRQPPEELLGESFEELEVRPGDSLSAIAGRTIDNELLFYSLARLNGIEVPRLLRPGQRIRVPVVEPVDTDEAAPAVKTAMQEADASDPPQVRARAESELPATARRLMERGRHRQAYALLLSAARAGKLQSEGDALLARAAVALARSACREDDPGQALKALNQASPWLGASAEAGDFVRQRRHVEARLSLDRAEQALARGDHGGAFDAVVSARDLADDLRETHGPRLERLETALVEHYHDGGLSAWRDQQVERSIELWERVVTIDPAFEPAVRYLERARRAREELKALGQG